MSVLPAGRLFESDVLGYAGKEKRFPKGTYLPFQASLEDAIAKKPQDWNPRAPKTEIARRLYWLVARNFSKAERKTLFLFPALGTRFDLLHGVDLFFRYRYFTTVTIDLSTRPKSEAELRAHVIISPELLTDKNKKELGRLGRLIARALKSGIFSVPFQPKLRNPDT